MGQTDKKTFKKTMQAQEKTAQFAGTGFQNPRCLFVIYFGNETPRIIKETC
jgi:hypothetical protein